MEEVSLISTTKYPEKLVNFYLFMRPFYNFYLFNSWLQVGYIVTSPLINENHDFEIAINILCNDIISWNETFQCHSIDHCMIMEKMSTFSENWPCRLVIAFYYLYNCPSHSILVKPYWKENFSLCILSFFCFCIWTETFTLKYGHAIWWYLMKNLQIFTL